MISKYWCNIKVNCIRSIQLYEMCMDNLSNVLKKRTLIDMQRSIHIKMPLFELGYRRCNISSDILSVILSISAAYHQKGYSIGFTMIYNTLLKWTVTTHKICVNCSTPDKTQAPKYHHSATPLNVKLLIIGLQNGYHLKIWMPY